MNIDIGLTCNLSGSVKNKHFIPGSSIVRIKTSENAIDRILEVFSELTVLVSDKKSPMSRRLSCSCCRRICRFNLYASGALDATYVEEHFRTVTAVFLQSPCLTTRATAANYWGNLGETQSCMCMCAEEVRVCKILNMNCDFEQKKFWEFK